MCGLQQSVIGPFGPSCGLLCHGFWNPALTHVGDYQYQVMILVLSSGLNLSGRSRDFSVTENTFKGILGAALH